jgi:O-antigen/teichoic acid export membrane protein
VTGARVTGVYFVYVSWVNVLATVSALGFSLYVLRHVAALDASGRAGEAKGLILTSMGWVGAAGLLLVVGGFLLRRPVGGFLLNDTDGPTVLLIAAVGGAGMAILRVLAEGLKARERAAWGLAVEFVLVPGGVLLALGGMRAAGEGIRVAAVLVAHVLAIAGAVAVAATALMVGWWKTPAVTSKVRLSSLATYWAITAGNYAIPAAPYLVLPHVAAASDIGRFAVVHRLVGLAGTVNVALASFFGPRFARLRSAGDEDGLRAAYRKSQVASILAFAPLYLVFTGGGEQVLSAFGGEFRIGVGMLLIMATGRIVNVAAGLPDYFLSMTGREGSDLLGALGALALFGALVLAVDGDAGATGVAWAFTAAFAARALYGLVLVKWSLRSSRRTSL